MRDRTKLKGQLAGQPPVDLIAESANMFVVAPIDASLEFAAGGGDANTVTLHQGPDDVEFTRKPWFLIALRRAGAGRVRHVWFDASTALTPTLSRKRERGSGMLVRDIRACAFFSNSVRAYFLLRAFSPLPRAGEG